MIICMVVSGLALLISVANIIMFFHQKKCAADRQQAMLDYIDRVCDGAVEEAIKIGKDFIRKETDRLEEENKKVLTEFSERIYERINKQQDDIDSLKRGVCPDYEMALAAANAVNDFNAGVSAIMNFDPMAVAKARRKNSDMEVG